MSLSKLPVLVLFLLFGFFANAQDSFYHTDTIQEIKIYFEQSNWDELLDQYYVAGDKERLLCNVEVNGVTLDSVGIRYKGFSSVSVDRIKNPFNIKLDYIKKDQKYAGIDKIKLSNVIRDPSFLREVLSYEIGRKYMPASQANYANVYINDVFWGLYTNVEAVNKEFLSQHYGSNDNSFFKGNPAQLSFSGENSNLGNSHGTDTTDYYPYYDIESDYGWADLYELIDVLNEEPGNIESLLNVDRTLWMHAFNYSLVNMDSYIGFAQNYYLYQDDNGQFNPILWDLNQSFASFRITDASEFFDGFNLEEAKTIDPLLHYSSVSVIPRPLMRNLFENDTYRRMYLAHMRTIIEENFANNLYAQRGQMLQTLIEDQVALDTNKFYSTQDFYDNLDMTVTNLIEYPGITDLMDSRTEYLQSYTGFPNAPNITNIANQPQMISVGDELAITAEISGGTNTTLAYRYGRNDIFQKVEMLDDGNSSDGNAGDGVYGAILSNVGNAIHYYIYSENLMAGRFAPERAAYEYYVLQANINPGDIAINELQAINNATVEDEAGETDDWIELYNTTNFSINTAGLYLSDDLNNLQKWPLPDRSIDSDEYLMIWADSDEEQGALHANFKLSSAGESLYLVDENLLIIDSLNYQAQNEDRTWGRFPNGTGPFMDLPPTFGYVNALTGTEDLALKYAYQIFPNPSNGLLNINFEKERPIEARIMALDGQIVQIINITSNSTVNLKLIAKGTYFVELVFNDAVITEKVIIQ